MKPPHPLPFTEEQLARIKADLDSLEAITDISPAMRALIEERWPELAAKIVPERKH